MIFTFLLLLIITAGGVAITYLYDDDAPLVVRLAAGAVIGSVMLGLAGFLLALVFGLNLASVSIAALLCALPLIVFQRDEFRRRLRKDFAAFGQQRQEFFAHLKLSRLAVVFAYTGLIVMLWFFFERAMLETNGGIGTGDVNNLGDLPFHLLVINGFVSGQNFPPDNPIYSGVTFTYSFITDLVVAMMNVAGTSIRNAMFCQNMTLVIALIILLARFTYKLTNNTTAALLAPFLLLFNGGLGFLLFFGDAMTGEGGILGQIFALANDYTIRGGTIWRWGNSLTILFTTQRTLLLGLPLALIVLTKIWEMFVEVTKNEKENAEQTQNDEQELKKKPGLLSFLTEQPLTLVPFLVIGLFAGMLPLVHAHTFAVVMGMAALLAALSWRNWRAWAVFFAAAAITAIPELLFATAGSANEAESFVGWKFGWDNGEENPVWFWLVNTGLFIPLLAVAIGALASIAFGGKQRQSADEPFVEASDEPTVETSDARRARQLLLFYAPFALCFIVPNLIRLAPWVWDNIKVLLYWYVASIPLVAWLLAQLWQRSKVSLYLVPTLLVALIFSGWLDVWRIATRQVEHQILSPAMVSVAAQIRSRTPPRALIMTAPEYATVTVLSGRRWFLGYIGHVWSHGIAPYEREQIVKKIYAGGEEAKQLIEQNKINYVLVGPQERKFTTVNETFFQAYPVIAEASDFRVYQVGDSK